MLFTGSGVALVTPFKENGAVDFDALTELLNFHLENDTDAIIAIGTTGEAVTMDFDEKVSVVQHCVDVVDGQIPVIAGTGSNDTNASVKLTKTLSDIVDGVLVVTPYYNRANEEGLYQHFRSIAEATDKPVILYNVPGRTNVNIPVNLVKRLADDLDNVVAIKDATGDVSYTASLVHYLGDDFYIYSGNDDIVVPMMSIGGHGVISVSANILPKETAKMCQLALEGNFEEAGKMQTELFGIIDALFIETNPIPVKEALNMMGLPGGYYRLPLCSPSDATKDRLNYELKRLDLI